MRAKQTHHLHRVAIPFEPVPLPRARFSPKGAPVESEKLAERQCRAAFKGLSMPQRRALKRLPLEYQAAVLRDLALSGVDGRHRPREFAAALQVVVLVRARVVAVRARATATDELTRISSGAYDITGNPLAKVQPDAVPAVS